MFAIRRRAAASSMTGGRLSAHRVEHSRITLPNCVRYRARLNSALSFDSIRHKQAFAKAPRTQFTQSDGYDRGTVQRLSRNRASLQGYPEHGPKKTTGSAPNSYVDVGSVDPNVLRLNIGCIDLTEVSIKSGEIQMETDLSLSETDRLAIANIKKWNMCALQHTLESF